MAIVGARSYSLYVVHTPFIFMTIWFFSKYTSLPELSYSVLTLMVVFIATELMFRFVEKPSHRYAQHWR
jgi:peptidoglycan/LPS O-acetylase OafA/YrhL